MLLLGRKTARERLASFLIGRLEVPAHCSAPVTLPLNAVQLPMTRADIADYLGLTIETVSRTLTRLKTDGLIDIPSAASILLRNRRALESLATGLN
jgi:CRP/FNR family transcriptional regulator